MIYDYPEYYEVAFSFRDIPRESSFLHDCIQRFSNIPVHRLFEVACGFAPHAEELSKLGYHYVGLDINRNMLDYAASKWRSLSPRPELVEGDMVSFALREPVDFAFVMLGSLYLNSLDEMNRHFDSMAACLRPGSLYFLDWCIQFTDPLTYGMNNETVCERNGIRVQSRFNIKLIDPAEQMYEEVWTLNVDDHGRHRNFEMIERNRAIFPQEFILFIKNRPDFEMVGWWLDWDFSKPVEGGVRVDRPVVLLRRI